jgi:hypothetical protein
MRSHALRPDSSQAHHLRLQVHAALAAAKPANSRLPVSQPHLADAAGHRLMVGTLVSPLRSLPEGWYSYLC